MDSATAISLIVYILVVYRLSGDIAELDGPFDLYARFRRHLYEQKYDAWIQTGFNCGICLSFWISCILILIIYGVDFFSLRGVLIWFATAGGARLLFRIG